MQIRMDAEIVVLFKAVYVAKKYKMIGKRVVNQIRNQKPKSG